VPISRLQSDILRIIAARRDPDPDITAAMLEHLQNLKL